MKFRIPKLFVLLLVVAILVGFAFPAFAVEAEPEGVSPDAEPGASDVDSGDLDAEPGASDVDSGDLDAEPGASDVDSGDPFEQETASGAEDGSQIVEDAPADNAVVTEELTGGETGAVFAATGLAAMGADDTGGDNKANEVDSLEGLLLWLGDNASGTVKLTADITIPSFGRWGYIPVANPITIDTGAHSLIYDGGYMLMTNPGALITGQGVSGEGVSKPVVDVQNMGVFYGGSWLDVLFSSNITATGTPAQGGTALRIQTTNIDQSFDDVGYSFTTGKIRSYGKNSIGLELMTSFAISGWDVAVEGEESVAVLAREGASICFSRLSATGNGARSVAGSGDISVDTCIVQPASQGNNIQTYTSAFFPAWYPVKQGSAVPRNPGVPPNITGCSSATFNQPLSVFWDSEALGAIDIFSTGFHTVSGEIARHWYTPFFSDTPELTIEIRDPDVPCVFEVRSFNGEMLLCMWWTDAWTLEECTVWRSTDGGKTWMDCTEVDGVYWNATETSPRLNGFYIPEALMEDGAMFLVEAPGERESNLVQLSGTTGGAVQGPTGGDRVGTDRFAVILGGQKPVWPDPTDDEEEPITPPPGQVDDTPEDDPGGGTDTDTPGPANDPEPTGEDFAGQPGAAADHSNIIDAGADNLTPGTGAVTQSSHVGIVAAAPEEPDPVNLVASTQTDSREISDALVPATSGLTPSAAENEPAAQPVLSRPVANTATIASACIAAATLAIWALLRKIKVMKR